MSSVAGRNFMEGTYVTAQWVLGAFGCRKGFRYGWPLVKTAVKLGLIYIFVDRIAFHFTDFFSRSEMRRQIFCSSPYHMATFRQPIIK